MEIANKVGAAEIISRVVDDLKDEAEQYRKMVMESIEKIMGNLGSADIDSRLEEQLIDGILYAFQEQTNEVCLVFVFWSCIQWSLDNSHQKYANNLCELSRKYELSIHQSQWESIQFCKFSTL